MDLNEFIQNVSEQFDYTDASEFTPTTKFRELDEWSSLVGMSIIAMVRTEYGKKVTGEELRACVTLENLYNLVLNK